MLGRATAKSAAVARPMVVIAASDGELAALVARHNRGYVVEPGAGDHGSSAIDELEYEVSLPLSSRGRSLA